MRTRGLQVEILLSLLVVVVTATGVLGAVLVRIREADVRRFHPLALRALEAEAESPFAADERLGIRWWILQRDGRVRPRGAFDLEIDRESLELADEARRLGVPLLRAGPPWAATRLAAPTRTSGDIAVAWLPPAAPAPLILGLVLADVAIFTGFGAYVLRRRLVLPLQRLAGVARALADGESSARAPVEGVRETVAVATAFNEMTEALGRRSDELAKAVTDLRERNRSLQEARAGLDRAERLAAVGRLAAGVAHEVGNPLAALLSFVELARRDPGLAADSRGHLDKALRQGERVRDILRQLLDFSRPRRPKLEPVDLFALCRETVGLVAAQRRYASVDIRVESEGRQPRVRVDRNGAAQILLNLLLNAADAVCAGTPGPRIHVTLSAAPLRRTGEVVSCVVADNGPGIPDEDRERIFDPFFTTKPPGEGTGLGLSNAQRMAEEYGGSLELVRDRELSGAAFALCLPAEREAG